MQLTSDHQRERVTLPEDINGTMMTHYVLRRHTRVSGRGLRSLPKVMRCSAPWKLLLDDA